MSSIFIEKHNSIKPATNLSTGYIKTMPQKDLKKLSATATKITTTARKTVKPAIKAITSTKQTDAAPTKTVSKKPAISHLTAQEKLALHKKLNPDYRWSPQRDTRQKPVHNPFRNEAYLMLLAQQWEQERYNEMHANSLPEE